MYHARHALIAVALCTLALLPCGLLADQADLDALLRGVKVVNAPGLPGPVAAFGDQAFPVIAGGVKGGTRLPLVVASRFGKGRVVALGKDGFLDAGTLAMADTGTLLVNAVRWAARDREDIAVGIYRHDGLAAALVKRGLNARQIGLDELDEVDVFLVTPDHVEAREIDKLSAFVAGGKGLVSGELGWGWLQLNPGKTLTRDNLANRLLAPMGIVYLDGMLDRTDAEGYAVGEIDANLLNASKALDLALAHEAGDAKLTREQVAQITTALSQTAPALPPDDEILLPRIRKLAQDADVNVVPTLKQPVGQQDVIARLVLTLQIRDACELPAAQVKALPAADAFPGSVPGDAPRIERTMSVDTAVPGWHSTGLYAAPGELVTVRIPDAAVGKGLKVRIGSTHCRNWHQTAWVRAPEITREYPLGDTETQAANAFGGLVYITVPGDCELGAIEATVSGAVQAPYYVLGETSLDDWRASIRELKAPWAELASAKAVLTVPSAVIRELDDPERVMKLWDRILDTCADFAAWPSHDRKRAERYVADDQLCAGYMHAGYPIMIPTSAADKLVDYEHLTTEGNWGLYHETGHNHQSGDWTFGGTGEVTVNLFTLFVLDKVCGIDVATGRMSQGSVQRSMINYFDRGPDFDQWKRSPFLALMMYVQLQQEFGWDAFTEVFAEYRDLPDDQRPKNDGEERDQWMVRFSRHVGRNLGPFFQAWAVPTSEAARQSINELPVWLPDNFPPKNLKENRVARKAVIVSADSEEKGDGDADNVVDGFDDTIWHTQWSGNDVPGYPHKVVVDLGETLTIRGVTVTPRQRGVNGRIAQYEVQVSNDGEQWSAAAAGAFENDPAAKEVAFDGPVSCRYIKFTALKGFDDQVWASMAELDVIAAQ